MTSHPPLLGTAVVVGGGPAGLMAAERLAQAGCQVHVYDHMPSVARKLVLAGRSGLNLTHDEPVAQLLARYGDAPVVRAAVAAFPPAALREWAAALGQPTYVGSSGRVFPTAFMPCRWCAHGWPGSTPWGCRCTHGTAGWGGQSERTAPRTRRGRN